LEYQWSEESKTTEGIHTTKTSVWTIRNRIRQEADEIEVFHALEIGDEKWCKEHIPPNGSDPISEEGQTLLDQPDLLKDKRTLQWVLQWEFHTSR
jgi:hypothetical protein